MIDRVYLLCEDQLHERFLRQWLAHRKVKVVNAEVAPAGKNSASAFVRKQFLAFVVKAKSKAYQEKLGFIVVIDGDNLGVRRKLELQKQLNDAELMLAYEKRVVILVPSWSIDTWIDAICGADAVESTKVTDQIKRSIDDEMIRRATLDFDSYRRALPAHLPAMLDAQLELRKLDLA